MFKSSEWSLLTMERLKWLEIFLDEFLQELNLWYVVNISRRGIPLELINKEIDAQLEKTI